MTDDPHIQQSEAAAASEPEDEARFADLFDIRRIIGGLLLLYGVVLFVMGLFASDEDIDKAAGININLWGGLGLTVVALALLGWALLRPVGQRIAESPHEET